MTNVIITKAASWFGMEYENGGKVLGRDFRPAMWKTRKGAENYAKRKGLNVVAKK